MGEGNRSAGSEVFQLRTSIAGSREERTDRIGKVFKVVALDLRQCLICEGVLTRKAAFGHARMTCHPCHPARPESVTNCERKSAR